MSVHVGVLHSAACGRGCMGIGHAEPYLSVWQLGGSRGVLRHQGTHSVANGLIIGAGSQSLQGVLLTHQPATQAGGSNVRFNCNNPFTCFSSAITAFHPELPPCSCRDLHAISGILLHYLAHQLHWFITTAERRF